MSVIAKIKETCVVKSHLNNKPIHLSKNDEVELLNSYEFQSRVKVLREKPLGRIVMIDNSCLAT